MYRYYLIIQKHFYLKSGKFTIDKLMDLLYEHYGDRTLHHKPGNNRSNTRKKLFNRLKNCHLFKYIKYDNTFRIVSAKKLMDARYTLKRPVLDADLKSEQIFIDIMIGVILDGNNFKSYENTAKQTGYTERRIQQAVKRNNESGRFYKINNFIIDISDPLSRDAVEAHRRILLYNHGIRTPEPVFMAYKGQRAYYLALYAANSYYHSDSAGTKGQRYSKKLTRIKPVSEISSHHFKTSARLWGFTNKYSYLDYLFDHETKGSLYNVA